ncbi:hypothetical protein Bbelb_012650 [Branchiostoma belcheri]|nr:hypothetical protein Bbelb_012650 [Branchiostoma belcheri]
MAVSMMSRGATLIKDGLRLRKASDEAVSLETQRKNLLKKLKYQGALSSDTAFDMEDIKAVMAERTVCFTEWFRDLPRASGSTDDVDEKAVKSSVHEETHKYKQIEGETCYSVRDITYKAKLAVRQVSVQLRTCPGCEWLNNSGLSSI